jgi:hypothetical protein
LETISLTKKQIKAMLCRVIVLIVLFSFLPGANFLAVSASGALEPKVPRVNVPDLTGVEFTPAIFWFGRVDPSHNYADVRIYYHENGIGVVVHIIDRWLRYDTTPTIPELTGWDAVSLYLNMDANSGIAPGSNAYRFDSQVVWYEPQVDYQASYRGDGSGWQLDDISFTSETGWRGEGVPNDSLEDKGWNVSFSIPFTSLGLLAAPPPGTLWGLAIALHDRDDANTAPLADTVWPEQMDSLNPSTWGEMHFGIPVYVQPPAIPTGTTIIRHGLNGANVVDGHVGGHTVCGEDLDHWVEWGEANYAGYEQINIQNQWDISDYPCFSKFFITFPLTQIPPGQTIISASLSMNLFGNAGGGVWGEPPISYIQALTVDQDWDEFTLSWNSAPLATENISGTWVYPVDSYQLVLYSWDISRAVAQAYALGEPLRLALYSADGDMHSGKYFLSSDISDYDAAYRPTITIQWGNLCTLPGVECSTVHLPLVLVR